MVFLAAYLNVFVTQASCNLSHLFEQTAKTSHHHDGHDHHHGSEEVPPHHHDDKPDHTHDTGKKDNNCCNDKTSAFFASQGNPATSSVDIKKTVYTDLILIFISAFITFNPTVYNTKGYISYILPPPKIPDIRIFIQSFII